MAAFQVTAYSLNWSILNKKGFVVLQLATSSKGQLEVSSAEELAALAEILKNFNPVFFDGNGQFLETAPRPPGTA